MKRAVAVLTSLFTVFTFALAPVALAPVAAHAQGTTGGLTVPVTGTATPGGTITGTFTVQQFVRSTAPTNLTGIDAVGTFVFNTTTGVQSAKARVPVKSLSTGGLSTAAVTTQQVGDCDILTLDLGPIHLDLLGLVIDISDIHIDIVAQPGSGNLLGNLLCAIAGLLDPGGPLTNALNQLIGLLNQLIGIFG